MQSPSNNQNEPSSRSVWPPFVLYMGPPLAAAGAIAPAYRHLKAKSELQKGLIPVRLTFWKGCGEGIQKLSLSVGFIVGTQMLLQGFVEKAFTENNKRGGWMSMLGSSAVVGILSAPFLAVFNGQTMGWGVRESLRKFTVRQGLAISSQETAFVGGVSAADRLAVVMKSHLGDNKAVEFFAAYLAGGFGSLVGHPANTALTRWQCGLQVAGFRQAMWGALRKAHAIGLFSVFYKGLNQLLDSVK